MRCTDLTLAQAAALRDRIKPTRDYVARLVARMREKQFPDHDPLWQSAVKALQGLESLHFQASYAASQPGIRRKHQK